MLVQIKLKDPKSAYSDNGKAICGSDPIIVELTPFICGLVYRKEAELFEDPTDILYGNDVKDLKALSYFQLKKLAIDNNINLSPPPSKKQLIEMLKGKQNDIQ